MPKEASEQLAEVVESVYYRLKGRGARISPGNGLAQHACAAVAAFQVPRELPREGGAQHDPVAPYVAMDECRRHCTTSPSTACRTHTQLCCSRTQSIFVWTVPETPIPTGAELAPFVTQAVPSQARQVHHLWGCSWRERRGSQATSNCILSVSTDVTCGLDGASRTPGFLLLFPLGFNSKVVTEKIQTVWIK